MNWWGVWSEMHLPLGVAVVVGVALGVAGTSGSEEVATRNQITSNQIRANVFS